MTLCFKNKLGVISTVELERNSTIEEFANRIQDNGGIEKVRVNMITSSCNCGTDLTDFLLQDIDKEITLVNVTELITHYHISMLYTKKSDLNIFKIKFLLK